MRVMLVAPFNSPSFTSGKKPPKMQVGDEFTVFKVVKRFFGSFYLLVEMGDNSGFDVDHFATLPTSTADEMEEEVKEAIIM